MGDQDIPAFAIGTVLRGRAQNVTIIDRFSPNNYKSPADVNFVLEFSNKEHKGTTKSANVPIKIRATQRPPQFDGYIVDVTVHRYQRDSFVKSKCVFISGINYKIKSTKWWLFPLEILVFCIAAYFIYRFGEYYFGNVNLKNSEAAVLKDKGAREIVFDWGEVFWSNVTCGAGHADGVEFSYRIDNNNNISYDNALNKTQCVGRLLYVRDYKKDPRVDNSTKRNTTLPKEPDSAVPAAAEVTPAAAEAASAASGVVDTEVNPQK